MHLDKKDKMLLYELGLDSRQPIRTLAKKLSVSKSTVDYRIKRLIKNKIIVGFKTYINHSKIGLSDYVLYLKFQKIDDATKRDLIKYLFSSEEIIWLGSSYGNWELIAEIQVKDASELDSFLSIFYEKYADHILKKEVLQSVSEYFFSYKLGAQKSYKSIHTSFSGDPEPLSKKDMTFIRYLQQNPQYNLIGLSRHLGMSAASAQKKLSELKKRRIITGFSAQVDLSKIGKGWYLLQLSCTKQDKAKWIEYLKHHKNVYYVYRYIGEWDYEVGLYISDSKELEDFITDIKSRFPDMIRDYEFSLITELHAFK